MLPGLLITHTCASPRTPSWTCFLWPSPLSFHVSIRVWTLWRPPPPTVPCFLPSASFPHHRPWLCGFVPFSTAGPTDTPCPLLPPPDRCPTSLGPPSDHPISPHASRAQPRHPHIPRPSRGVSPGSRAHRQQERSLCYPRSGEFFSVP